jgi:hypothetical protein
LGAVPLLKAIRNPRSKYWNFIDIGRIIHTDNHAFAFHPTDNVVIYAGNDGGIYKSNDGGLHWDDTLNEGLCITQFEFMAHHPDSDAVVIAGTQDNGTLQFRNNSVFYQCAKGDGGFVAIDPKNPNIVYHEYYGPTPYRSDEGGNFGAYENGGSWKKLYDESNNFGSVEDKTSLFYPPFVLDPSGSNNIALGTTNIHLYEQEQTKWNEYPLTELLSEELISAINYVNSNLMYIGTTKGNIFILKKINNKWTPKKIKTDSKNEILLPSMYIWDIATYPENDNIIIVALGGYNSNEDQSIANKAPSRVWRGEISDEGVVKWKNISGKNDAGDSIQPNTPVSILPNTPVNAIAIEPNNPYTLYVGTDIGIFRTTDGGESWKTFGKGFPKCAVLDMRIFWKNDEHKNMRLLRAVTHGRGMWELELDKRDNKHDVDLYVRDHLMDTGRYTPSSSGGLTRSSFDDPLRNINYIDTGEHKGELKFDGYDYLTWWMCADIKVDPPFYQMDIEEVDYVKFEYRIKNKDLQKGRKNRVYVQIHNRGVKEAGKDRKDKVSIKLLFANVTPDKDITTPLIPQLPNIPHNFWTDFSNKDADLGEWKQIGEIKCLPEELKTSTNIEPKFKTLTNVEPTVVCWEWDTPEKINSQVGLMVVVDSPEDPIPPKNQTIFDIENLVRNEKHIGVSVVKVQDSIKI